MKNSCISFCTVLFFFFILGQNNYSQPQLTVPDASQKAAISQRIGLTDISISYNRPGVKGRSVLGELVPFDQVWRAGANKNTTISFSTDVLINGQKLRAGTYGLHMIPTKGDWMIIFSNNYWSWGSFNYDVSEDALRINVSPGSGDYTEWLQYTFDSADPNSTTVSLRWDKLKVSFKIDVDIKSNVLANFRREFDDLQGFFWQPWNQAANYCLQNKFNLEEGLTWVDRSIGINRNALNQVTKMMILDELGRKSEAEELKTTVFTAATEADINTAGYQYLTAGKIDEAIKIFKMNTEKFPGSWNAWDSLAEGYMTKGEKDQAIKYYNKALGMAPENQKARITNTLNTLKK